MKPARLFLIIGILFGVGLAVFAPFGTGFDEDKHLARVYDISGLHMLPNRSIYDKTVYFAEFYTLSYRRFFYRDQGAELFTPAYFGVKADYDSMAIETIMSTYPPLMFFPQAVVAGIAWRALDLPIIPVAIVIRLVTLAVYMLGCYLAIRTTPVAKWLFLVAALLPTPLYQASTVNGDGYTHAVCLLFIAVVLSVVFQSEATISRRRFLSLCAAVFLLAMAKPGSILLLPLLLLIPRRVFTTRSQRLGLILLTAGMSIFHLVWIYFSFTNTSLGVESTGMVVSSVLSQLWAYLGAFWRSLLFHWRTLFGSMIAASGYWGTDVSPLVYGLVGAVLLVAILFTGHDKRFRTRTRIFFIGMLLLTWFGILVMYTAGKFTYGEKETMAMVQGRYLVSFLLLGLLAVWGIFPRSRQPERWAGWFIGVGIVAFQALFFWGIFAHYYTPCGPSLFSGRDCQLPAYQNIEIFTHPEVPLEQGVVLEQRFTNTCRRLAAVAVLVDDGAAGARGGVELALNTGQGGVVARAELDAAELTPLKRWTLDLPPGTELARGEYSITLRGEQLNGAVPFAVRTPDRYPGALTLGGQPFDGDLVFYYYCAPVGLFGY